MKIIYATNPDGPWIYQLDDVIIDEVVAWEMINSNKAELNDSEITDYSDMDFVINSSVCF